MKLLVLPLLLCALPMIARGEGYSPLIPKAHEIRPGVFKTSVTLRKAMDVRFRNNFGWLEYNTVERVGQENACPRAQAYAKSVGSVACADRYRQCRVQQVITQESLGECTKIVYVEAKLPPKHPSVQPPAEEIETGAADAR